MPTGGCQIASLRQQSVVIAPSFKPPYPISQMTYEVDVTRRIVHASSFLSNASGRVKVRKSIFDATGHIRTIKKVGN